MWQGLCLLVLIVLVYGFVGALECDDFDRLNPVTVVAK